MSRWLVLAASLLMLMALVAAEEEKRPDMSAVPFVLGSRYGRSQPRMLAPRNDRFFMGSRYGKRSWSPPSVPQPAPFLCHCSPLPDLGRDRRGDDMLNEADD